MTGGKLPPAIKDAYLATAILIITAALAACGGSAPSFTVTKANRPAPQGLPIGDGTISFDSVEQSASERERCLRERGEDVSRFLTPDGTWTFEFSSERADAQGLCVNQDHEEVEAKWATALSVLQARHPDYLEQVDRCLEEHGPGIEVVSSQNRETVARKHQDEYRRCFEQMYDSLSR